MRTRSLSEKSCATAFSWRLWTKRQRRSRSRLTREVLSRMERWRNSALGLAFLGGESDARADRVPGAAQPQGAAVHGNATRPDGPVAGEREGQLGASGSHEPGQGDHLSGTDVEVDSADVVRGDVLQPQDHLVAGDVLPHEQGGQVTAHHQADDLPLIGVAGFQDSGDRAVAQDGDAVGEAEDLLHAVGDVDDGDALVPEPVDQAEERLDLVLGEGGGGLVEGNDLGLTGQSPQDLHQLALCGGEFGSQLIGVDDLLEAEPGQVRGDAAAQLCPVQAAQGGARQGPGVHVLGDRDVRDDLRLLRDDADPGLVGVVR
ncbi:hypothetical protein GCM10020254_03550 [Streptomyces goshikiensis]